MADSAEGAGFWLPSEFFDDCLMDKENIDKNQSDELDSEFCFPTEFPYDFGTKSNEHLEKRRMMSTSPQSTLAHMEIWGGSSNGSPNGVPSHPTTPSGDAVEDLIYLAASQVAKLKLSGGGVPGPTKHKGPPKNPNPSVIHKIYLEQSCGMWYSEVPMAWPNSGRIGVLLGGGAAAVKRECAGTGVFLPRRYGNNAYYSDSRRRPGYSAASIPNRNVDALNKNLDNMNGFPQSQPHFQPKFSRGFVPEYNWLMARRSAIMLHHRSSVINRGVYLPQEWTY